MASLPIGFVVGVVMDSLVEQLVDAASVRQDPSGGDSPTNCLVQIQGVKKGRINQSIHSVNTELRDSVPKEVQ